MAGQRRYFGGAVLFFLRPRSYAVSGINKDKARRIAANIAKFHSPEWGVNK